MSTAKVLFPNDEEIYKIVRGLPNAEKLQDKIWESFCLENETVQSQKKCTKQRRFKKHPSNFDKDENTEEENESSLFDIRNKADDYSSVDSDDIAEAVFDSRQRLGHKTKCQSAKCHRISADVINDDEYDSLEEFCDVTFRNIGSITRKSNKTPLTIEDVQNEYPTASRKKIIPLSVVPSTNKSTVKMMAPIKPLKKPSTLKGNLTVDNSVVGEKNAELDMDIIPVEYDMNKDRKLKTVLQKCNNAMDDIRLLIDIGIPQPDGEEDYLRRKKRAVEFSNRFSRIYLYQLNRLINDIRKLLRPHTTHKALSLTTSVKMNLSSRTNITQKFIQTLQLVQQSLQAYHNHLPTSIVIGAPEKLKDLLNLCITVCQLQNVIVATSKDGGGGDKLDDGTEVTDNIFTPFSTRCKSLLERINECCQIDSTTSLLQSDRSKLSLLGYNVAKGKDVGDVNSKMQVSVNNSRFSMYGGGGQGNNNNRGCRKDAYWRNAIAALGKKHFNVTSKYKTAKFKHRPDVDRMQFVQNQHRPGQPSFQAFPINTTASRPTTSSTNYSNNKTHPNNIANANLSRSKIYSGNLRDRQQQMMMMVDRNQQSNMSLVDNRNGPTKRRGRQRYSLNDDDINTVVQSVAQDNNAIVQTDDDSVRVKDVIEGRAAAAAAAVESGRAQSAGGSRKNIRKQQDNHHLTCCGHTHLNKSKSNLPQTPQSSPQQTPHLHLTNELIGESSQCDLAPPTIIKTTPPAPASTTANTPKESLCELHKSKSYKLISQKNHEDLKEFVTDQQETCQTCHQIVIAPNISLNDNLTFAACAECQECQKHVSNNLEQSENIIDPSDDWTRLSIDCDRTMKSLDERTLRREKNKRKGNKDKAVLEEEEDGGDHLIERVEYDELMREEQLANKTNLSKRDLVKRLTGLVKKNPLKGERVQQEAGDGEKKIGSGGDKRRDKVTVTSVTGAKNAKLICIRDDNSLTLDTTTSDIVENSENNHKQAQQIYNKTSKRNNTNGQENMLQYVHSQTQTDVSQEQKQFKNNIDQSQMSNISGAHKRKNVKISRLPKAKMRRQLQMLDKEMSLNVIRYKLDYHKARKDNPMYKKKANGTQPWTLMEKVSDGILDHLLLSVAREIQVDDILVKLYESEFYAA